MNTSPTPQPSMPQSDGTPITLAKPSDVIPHAYNVIKHTQRCRACGSLHEHSDIFARNFLRSRTGAGKLVTHLIPVSEFTWNVPITVIVMEARNIPICHECAGDTTLSHLPVPPAGDARIVGVPQEVIDKNRPRQVAKPKGTRDSQQRDSLPPLETVLTDLT